MVKDTSSATASLSLEQALKNVMRGEVLFDDGSKALYATDGSNYRQIPIAVIKPVDENDIMNAMAVCHQYNVPVLNRGGGTSLAGQCCNVAVIMDLSMHFNKILAFNKEEKLVKVQPGIVLDKVRNYTEDKASLTFGPDPATHSHCTIGGMLGNNSCGVHSVMAAKNGRGARTSDNLARMTILTYDGCKMEVGPTTDAALSDLMKREGRVGEIYRKLKGLVDKYSDLIRERFPNIPRRVSGYNLPALLPENGFNVAHALAGSESTCVTILDATLHLINSPRVRVLIVLGFQDIYTAADAVPSLMKEHDIIGLEGIDELLIEYMKKKKLNIKDIPLLPEGKGWLLVELGDDNHEEACSKAKKLIEGLQKLSPTPSHRLIDNPEEAKMIWEIRESGLGATAWVPGEPMTNPGWEDSAVPPERVGDYLRDLRALFNKYGYNPSLYGHFGQGCIHCRVAFDLLSEEGIEQYKLFTKEAAVLVRNYNGSISGEHGDGQARGDLLEIMYGPELMQAFHEFKHIWDPHNKMNPGKVLDTYGQTANLRLGTDYAPADPETYFHFLQDEDSFARATLRCVGIGNCRREEGGTMCPSYMVTHEEMHSTRGRAHLLNEMLRGEILKDGWKNDFVKEALDLCLSCKGCKSDCPVNVDMATYKAEFLSHYYQTHRRPVSAYLFGWIPWWSRVASVIPEIANFMLNAPILKKAGGIAVARKLPAFAEMTFRQWYRKKKPVIQPSNKKVILWTDTFNNFFLPQTLVAAYEVLSAAGFGVIIPSQPLCCGRPLYDFGMLQTAKRLLNNILVNMRKEIRTGIPVVGLEPSCVAVFRDELLQMLPGNQDAKRLSKQTYTLAEFLNKYADNFQFPQMDRKAVLHGHCHQKSLFKLDNEMKIFAKMGMTVHVPDSGCCGVAGYFGYQNGKPYDVSVKLGERVLLPEVRKCTPDTIIIADGFSCRNQIEHGSTRKGMHLAQVIQMGIREQHNSKIINRPEKKYVDSMRLKNPRRKKNTALLIVLIAGALAVKWLAHLNEHRK